MKKFKNHPPLKRQQGAALLVALVILLVISMIGVASIRTSTLEMKMANSQRDRDAAFAAAEAGLTAAEEWLELNNPQNEDLIDTCGTGTNCFEATCTGGLCFDGEYAAGNDRIQCIVGDSSATTERVTFWSDATLDVWNNGAKHRTVSVAGFDEDVKYIVEFLCYAPESTSSTFDAANPNNAEPIYRITALAEGNGDRAQVMLQSTYFLVES